MRESENFPVKMRRLEARATRWRKKVGLTAFAMAWFRPTGDSNQQDTSAAYSPSIFISIMTADAPLQAARPAIRTLVSIIALCLKFNSSIILIVHI